MVMEPVIGSTRLFAAFETASQSPGAELRSTLGPSGSPAKELVRAFEDAMTPPATVPAVDISGNIPETGSDAIQPLSVAPGPAESMPMPDGKPLFRVDAMARPEDSQLSHRYSVAPAQEAGISPIELYQAQYQTGLLCAYLNLTVNASQNLTQSLETVLKQSG